MNLRERYFDNAATTPLDPRVLEEMLPYLRDDWGNAHSIHAQGLRAMQGVDTARERIAMLVGADDPAEIAFTSGATEANNWVLRGFTAGSIGPFEHSSVKEPAEALGYQVLRNQGEYVLPPDSNQPIISLMAVNNEIGTIFQASAMRNHTDILHSDLTQAIGKVTPDLDGLDFGSLSGHKFYGPKGVGALYARGAAWPDQLLRGGEQEFGARAGTLNVPSIVGMGVAAAIAADEGAHDRELARELRAIVLEGLSQVSDVQVNGGDQTVPHILSLSFRGIEGESLVVELDARAFAISSGAACSSRSTEPSHVLTALGLEQEWLRGTVRISFGRFNTKEAARELGRELEFAVNRLRRKT
ncbi:MAG TPA: cysteine desulfurase family protein [Fimbriimonadaceae bacterium]|nr:cysteine desulfurase family protein [Fimbriimonadaceae bacterium]